jgi:cyclomaltodextrinase / maltogenic alpha-amylase / neopullulanase
MSSVFQPTCFYHVYPLGQCGAPLQNSLDSEPVERLAQLSEWVPYWQKLGIEALYLGPVFESQSHGYDTVDYFQLDRRLGHNSNLIHLAQELHTAGIKLVLDGVFNHVGRRFFAFADVLQAGQQSRYCDWFELDFGQSSPFGDPFAYACWEGHAELVKLNLRNPEVQNYLFAAVESWIRDYDLDGLRLDVAYALEPAFLQALSRHCRALKPSFWLLGEVIHGGYRSFLEPGLLDSVTNYEGYKALYSSHNDGNYFELSHHLERQFSAEGLCREKPLYNFADNHDVNRVASQVKDPRHLYPLSILLMTMPGIPSLYAGSEWGLTGEKRGGDDSPLRPALNSARAWEQSQKSPLWGHTQALIGLRKQHPDIFQGVYQPLAVSSQQLAFRLQADESLIAVNMADQPAKVQLKGLKHAGVYQDLLNPGQSFELGPDNSWLSLDPHWGRILKRVA